MKASYVCYFVKNHNSVEHLRVFFSYSAATLFNSQNDKKASGFILLTFNYKVLVPVLSLKVFTAKNL